MQVVLIEAQKIYRS